MLYKLFFNLTFFAVLLVFTVNIKWYFQDELFGKMLANQNASEYSLPNSQFYSTPMKRRTKPKSMKPLFTTLFWFCLLMCPILSFLYKIFISSWKGKYFQFIHYYKLFPRLSTYYCWNIGNEYRSSVLVGNIP